MKEFQFRMPGTIIAKPGSAVDPETYKPLNLRKKVLLVTDKTLNKLGIAGNIKEAIEKAGSEVFVFDEVEPEPGVGSVRKILDYSKDKEFDTVVGLGGGSPMDIAKIVALQLNCLQPIESMYGVGNATGKRLPLILIPSTAGTGSEGTPVAVVTGDDNEKSPIVGPQFLCDSVILDAALSLGLPPGVTAATGIDAIVHAIEAYTSGVRKNPVSDQLALQALNLLYNNIRQAVYKGNDLEVRSNMLAGSMMAGLAFANASVGAVHALAYPLGTEFHIAHGESNALTLIPVMKFNLADAESMYGEIARHIIHDQAFEKGQNASDILIERLESLIPDLGLNTRLSDYNIGMNDLEKLTEGTLKQERLLSYNITALDGNDIFGLFKSIL